MTLLRSLLYQLLFVPWTLICGLAFLPFLLVSRRAVQRAAAGWLEGAHLLQRLVLGLRYEVRGRGNIPTGAALFASKHQSAWETLIFHALLADCAFVLKKELLWLPLIGLYLLRSGQIVVDRSGGARTMTRMLRDAKAAVAEGRQVVIFPEGHRQPPGATGEYLPGVALLYEALDVPLIPVALNSGLFWGRNALVRRPGRIVIEFLPAPPKGLAKRAAIDELRARIEPATRALEAEARREFPYLG